MGDNVLLDAVAVINAVCVGVVAIIHAIRVPYRDSAEAAKLSQTQADTNAAQVVSSPAPARVMPWDTKPLPPTPPSPPVAV